MSEYSSSGAQYGNVEIADNRVVLKSVTNDKKAFSLKLENVSQCVLPQNNRKEVELQFNESNDTEGDCLVQLTFHFGNEPKKADNAEVKAEGDSAENASDAEVETESAAEAFQRSVLATGVIKTLTSNIIVEFTRDQGTFVTPRGRYLIQVLII